MLHHVTRAQRLTRSKLIKQDNWAKWKASEYTQLDQYDAQGMFGEPCYVTSDDAVFNLVWTYAIKEVEKQMKAWCTCDRLPHSGQVRILDYTYANCVDQTSTKKNLRGVSSKNLIIFCTNVSNTFAKAPPPKQGF